MLLLILIVLLMVGYNLILRKRIAVVNIMLSYEKKNYLRIKREAGAEAESLRIAFEQMLKRDCLIHPEEIQETLDRIDARESLSYLEDVSTKVINEKEN